MEFTNFICWDSNRVSEVMNTNAELAERAVFLAVHSEYPLKVFNPGVGDIESAPRQSKNPHEFLKEFLHPEQRHVQIAVLGESGSGKSHFIKWMFLNIPTDEYRYIISVPRSGISLRGVINLILAVLPREQAHPYQAQLDQAGFQRATETNLQDRFISAIARSIQEDEISTGNDQDVEEELIKRLPSLFDDPSLKPHFKNEGGPVEQIVKQAFSTSTERGLVQERLTFTTDDLPTTFSQPAELSRPARDLIDVLRSDHEVEIIAVKLINRNVNKAISQMMNFTGDRLQNLLIDVRKHLRSQGKELILLVEDLSRMQGLDTALLDSLIEEGNDSNGLCTLRWAAAAPKGYYATLADSVKTRMSSLIDMDLSKDGDDTVINNDKIVQFASKYMNAVRIPQDDLYEWAQSPDEDREAPPNRCDNCEFKPVCHEAFESEQGIGLYPLNKDAIINMLGRRDPNFDRFFTPRVLVKDVLSQIFGLYSRDLSEGKFPSNALLGEMGGQRLAPAIANALRTQSPSRPESQIALAELWGTIGNPPVDLSSGVYAAFGLTKPPLAKDVIIKAPIIKDIIPPPVDPRLNPRITAIRGWGNGNIIIDQYVTFFRPLVYQAIVSHIDWDKEGLVQTEFASQSSLFRTADIGFHGQQTNFSLRPVTIRIPLTDDVIERGLDSQALEGLLLWNQNKSWDFPNGWSYYSLLANRLDNWCAYLIDRFKSFPTPQKEWNPTASAIELLAIGAMMAGRPTDSKAPLPVVLNSLFEEWPEEIASKSRSWRTLYEGIRKEQKRLQDIALARATGSKGGRGSAFIDPSKIIPLLRSIRRNWELKSHPPEAMSTLRDDYGNIARLYARVANELPGAISDEWHRRTDWVEEWRQNVPEEISRKELVDSVNELLEAVEKTGTPVGRRVREIAKEAVSALDKVQLDDALKAATDLKQEQNPAHNLGALGRERGSNAMAAADEFLPAMRALLDDLEASEKTLNANRGQAEDEIRIHQSTIKQSLAQLSQDLGVLGGI